MDFAEQLWQTYLQDHAPKIIGSEVDLLRGDDLRRAIWWFAGELSARSLMLIEVDFDDSFWDDADSALVNLALTGDRASLRDASLGAWRVLEGRWLWFMTAMEAAEAAGAGASIPVPRYGSVELRETAALLVALGGPARDVPPELRPQATRGRLADLLSSGPTWRH